MTKSEIFKKAHQLTKTTLQAGDSYSATFSIALKIIYAEANNITEKLLAMGLRVWEKYGKKRIYMSIAQFNEVTGRNYSLNDKKNKIFYDFETNAIMRTTHKNKTTIEVQL